MSKSWVNEEAIKRWDDYAEQMGIGYSEDGDLNRRYLLNPTIFSLIGNVDGKRVLDAGCGEGYLCRKLANKGALVTGVDYSQKMIEVAVKKTPHNVSIDYMHGNCEELDSLEDHSFDLIISNMVLHDLANYKKAIQEMYRLLVEDGVFVFSILHPCFDTPESGWQKDENGNKLYWKVTRYFDEGPYEQRSESENKLLYFHRTLTSYITALREAGFTIDVLIEPKPDDEAIDAHTDFAHFLKMCHFLVIRAIKP